MTNVPTSMPRSQVPRPIHYAVLAILIVLAATAALLLAREWGTRWNSTTVVHGSGIAAIQSRRVPAFTRVDLAGSNNVTVHIREKQAVVVEGDENLIDRVTTEVETGTLVLGTNGSFTTARPMTVDVTVPTLDAVVLSGSGVLTVDGLRAEQFTVRVTGEGLVAITGRAARLDVSLAGSGDAQLQNLVARDVDAMLSGSGRLQVHATDSLDASVPGTGVIDYRGDPRNVTQNITGTGAVTKG